MFRKPKHIRRAHPQTRRPTSAVFIEAIEPRTMLSATVPATVTPDDVFLRSATTIAASDATSAAIQGYTPAQISAAYGFTDTTFSSGTVTADGAGQTIALIDAYNDPDIAADLSVFDTEFNLPSASLKVVNQTGGSSLPATNADWAGEISLDVEWAHAIAPAADILLVEASSDNTDDLIAAVNYARSAEGVSVVSMSWGGSEFESSYDGSESSSQTAYDADFTTPAGHQGVTFVSAAGDSGQQDGVQWPASSPNVLSVGGTTLTLDGDGTYVSETGWSGTSSGTSTVEAEPAYQDAVQPTGSRSVSDVSYSADPDDGFAVYDSLADDGYVGWQEVGGTSAGAPQWAALIAIADQGRAVAGLSTLDGVGQTLPDLYDLYSAPGTTGYATYATYFNDVTSGGSGSTGGFPRGRHGGFGDNDTSATAGYDYVTGLGTPKAEAIIADLATAKASTGTTTTTGGSGGTTTGGGTTTSALSLSPVAISLLTTPPADAVAGTSGTLKVRLNNSGTTAFSGAITVIVYASTDTTVANQVETLSITTLSGVKLKAGASRNVTVKYTWTASLAGTYYLVAGADAVGTDTQPTTAASSAVLVAAQSADLSVAFASAAAVTVTPGKKGKAVVRVTDVGNTTATGNVTVTLDATTTGVVDANATQLVQVVRKVKIAVGKSVTFDLPFTAPADLTPSSYSLVATITSTTTPTDTNIANDSATASTQPA